MHGALSAAQRYTIKEVFSYPAPDEIDMSEKERTAVQSSHRTYIIVPGPFLVFLYRANEDSSLKPQTAKANHYTAATLSIFAYHPE